MVSIFISGENIDFDSHMRNYFNSRKKNQSDIQNTLFFPSFLKRFMQNPLMQSVNQIIHLFGFATHFRTFEMFVFLMDRDFYLKS